MKYIKMLLTCLLLFSHVLYSQALVRSDRSHADRRFAIHDGNQVRTLFYNYGSIGRPNTEPSFEWPAFSNHGYAYEFGLLIGAEVENINGDTIHIISDGMLDGGDYDPTGSGEWWGWEPLPGYAAVNQSYIAMSNDYSSWPSHWLVWPGKYGDDVIIGDLESYWLMDDRYNVEFEYYPVPSDSLIRGLGVEVSCRGYQWGSAPDFILFSYDIKNISERNLNKMVVGIIIDPHIGGAGDFGDDYAGYIDNNRIDSYSGDLQWISNMMYSWDKENSGNDYGIPWNELGWLGIKFLNTPGNAFDGADNDNDTMIDESQSDGIDNDDDWDLTDDDAIADTAEASIWNDWIMWNSIDDDGDGRIDDWGDLDGLSDDLNGNGVPDLGEPDFESTDLDEIDILGMTSAWIPYYGVEAAYMDELMWQRLSPGNYPDSSEIAQEGDNILIAGSGYFTLIPGETKQFTIAIVFGQGKDNLLNNAMYSDFINRTLNANFQLKTEPANPVIPQHYFLAQNYPNPFNPNTTIRYALPERTPVQLVIYDLLGREIRTLVSDVLEPGFKTVVWDGRDEQGRSVAAGVYLYRIEAGEYVQTKKLVVLK